MAAYIACRHDQALEPQARPDDARLQVAPAARVHRLVCHALARAARPQDGGADGQQAQDAAQPAGALAATLQKGGGVAVNLSPYLPPSIKLVIFKGRTHCWLRSLSGHLLCSCYVPCVWRQRMTRCLAWHLVAFIARPDPVAGATLCVTCPVCTGLRCCATGFPACICSHACARCAGADG